MFRHKTNIAFAKIYANPLILVTLTAVIGGVSCNDA